MARTAASKAPKPSNALSANVVNGSKALATIDQELAAEAADLKSRIGQPSGNKIKVEPVGKFVAPDGQDLGSEIQVVILDFVARNNFYTGPYNPTHISPPDCYAIGTNIAEMAPEADSPIRQHDKCGTCPLNAFGTGTNGKGKACQNRRLIAVLLVDPENPDAHNTPDAPIYTLDIAPKSTRSFDGFTSAAARAFGHPLKAVATVTATNAGTYAEVSFIEPVPNPHYALHAARRAECHDLLHRKPDFTAAAARPPARGGAAARQAAPARRTAAATGARR